MTTDTDRDTLIDSAKTLLGATAYCRETRFAWVDDSGDATIATDDDLAALGRLIEADSGKAAYENWGGTTLRGRDAGVDAASTVAAWREQGASFARGVAGLRDDAAAYGDLLTVVACDLLGEQLEQLLAAEEVPSDEPGDRRKIVGEIFRMLGVAELRNRYLPRDLRGRAEDAGLIQRVEGPCDYDWSIASEELVILGAATPAVVAEAKRILAGTVRAVRMHGHGQGQVAQPDTAARVPMEAPAGLGPSVEIVRRGG